jgi:hypothetical protein
MLSDFQRFFDVYAEISNSVVNFGMPKQNLDCAYISCGFVDHRCFCPSKSVRAVIFASQPDSNHPFINQSGVLSSTGMISMINPTGEGVVIDCAAPAFGKNQRETGLFFEESATIGGNNGFRSAGGVEKP